MAVGVAVQRGDVYAHRLAQRGEAVIGAQAGPVVVGAVVDVLVRVLAQGSKHVHVVGVGQAVAVLYQLRLAVVRREIRQAVRPDLALFRYKGKVNVRVRVLNQLVHVAHVRIQGALIRGVKPLYERLFLAVGDVVVLFLAQRKLAGGL